jgi:hyperosmotically inducible protein
MVLHLINKIMLIAALAPVLAMVGCGTAYKAAVDERSLETQMNDQKITMDIRGKFVDDKTVDALGLSTYCYYGHVYLVGEYEKPAQRDQAVKLARQVPGVKSVTDHFLPKKKDPGCGLDDNLAIEAKIRAALIGDKNLSSTQIETKLIQCHAVLVGLVGSEADIQKATAHARSVAGVRSVKSYLRTAR